VCIRPPFELPGARAAVLLPIDRVARIGFRCECGGELEPVDDGETAADAEGRRGFGAPMSTTLTRLQRASRGMHGVWSNSGGVTGGIGQTPHLHPVGGPVRSSVVREHDAR
jgi:hypothetical protein